ncbi:MAG TPA: exosortase B [Gallionella sp.]|nr:exosortase B [Gallionella sp.]
MSIVSDSQVPFSKTGAANLVQWWPVLLGLCVLFVPTYQRLAYGLWTSEEQAHGPIVLILVLWLLWRSKDLLAGLSTRPAPLMGTPLLLLGLSLYVVGRSQSIPIFEVSAQIPILIGTILLLSGKQALRVLIVPILFLFFLVPIPGLILDALTGPLKEQISALVENILYALGYPIARSGVVLNIGPYQLLIADACSGLNSMFSLGALGLFYIHIMQHRHAWRNWMLGLSIIPIAFFANTVRVIGLVLLTYYFGDEVGQGFFHKFTGMVLFVFSILTLVLFDSVLNFFARQRAA